MSVSLAILFCVLVVFSMNQDYSKFLFGSSQVPEISSTDKQKKMSQVTVDDSSSTKKQEKMSQVEVKDSSSTKKQEKMSQVTPFEALVANKHNQSSPKVLVAYTGALIPPKQGRPDFYLRNTDYFLKYGVKCHDRDTVIAVAEEYYDRFLPKVKAIQDSQCKNGHFVLLVSRRTDCYDMETVRMIVNGSIPTVKWPEYDYFVHLNYGVTGPHPDFQDTWLQIYLDKLQSPVHMTGLSVNCDPSPHIQSMMYAVDRVGMDLIQTIPYDCTVGSTGKPLLISEQSLYHKVIAKYEIGMSRLILEKGHAIAPATMQSGIVLTKGVECDIGDIWWPDEIKRSYGGRTPSFYETIFWRSSRFYSGEVARMIFNQGKGN